ncbi:hypothetical protein [Micromonospora sp. NBC_00858]|uniref:hypothetical protein n=1 Tax=Micromonospora sp. NBC_00858 TaxID=2975979 RepID=UPI003863917A|nr:hypothetical protein OG990_30340 [Micromonospora sp. NBC_00858]
MSYGIRGMLRGGRGGSDGVAQHTVGNALVLHIEDEISAEAQSLALSVIEDTKNDVVVLDLGTGLRIGSWESMVGVLPRRRRGIRLVACGQHRNAAAMAGQWLSERLKRTVIAPDGDLVRGSAGTLFVHSTTGSGWVRFRPGKPPTWDAKRYPAPRWDKAATERRASSSTGEVEPLPSGVWIHDVRDPETIGAHRRRLVAEVPCQPETMTVLLGCPGTEPLSLDDVVRFWRDLDPDSRARTRFVQYGDIRMPEDEPFGQALADLLETGIVCYTGVPVGSPHRYEIRTVRQDGALGWAPFALELGYLPRAHPNSKARRPVVLSHRAPLGWTEEIAPRVYWYAPDAVIEVVQAGLWVRSAEEPVNAERVRAAVLDPESNTLIFDDTVDTRADRMRELARDLNARLDQRAGIGGLFQASAFLPGTARPGRAQASVDIEPAAVPSGPPNVSAHEPPVARMMESMVIGEIAALYPVPAGRPEERARDVASQAFPQTRPAEATPDVARFQGRARVPEPVEPPVESATAPFTVVKESATAAFTVADAPAPPEPARVQVDIPEPVRISVAEPTQAHSLPDMSVLSPGVEAPARPVDRQAVTEAPLPPPASVPPPAARSQTADGARGEKSVRIQPVPTSGASALLPKRALDEERGWLRRTLSREFDAMASSVMRIMSEHPGLQGGSLAADDVLADSVAVRLYLSRRGEGVDAGLRSGKNGPHVPLARCAVSGLSRLPSIRGTTVYRMSPGEPEWELYANRRLVTAWSFVNALSGPCSDQEGDTDVLIWSMTGRRTGLLEPENEERVTDRVVFLPGTSFKILETRRPSGTERGAILLREIGTNEIDDSGRVDSNRVSLDELAVTSLGRSVERWAGAEERRRIGPASGARFTVLPGLERKG